MTGSRANHMPAFRLVAVKVLIFLSDCQGLEPRRFSLGFVIWLWFN